MKILEILAAKPLARLSQKAPLAEAPIEDIQTYGDWQKPGSMRGDDMGIVGNPKGQDKIKRVLFNIPVPVVLHVINDPTEIRGIEGARKHITQNSFDRWIRGTPQQRVGLMTPEDVQGTYGVQLKYQPNAFNLVIVENEGASRYPLTPWIIAHRMKHAFDFIDKSYDNRFDLSLNKKIQQTEFDFLRMIGKHTGLWGMDGEKEQLNVLLSSMLDTKAGRAGNLITPGEFMPEAFALFCIRGKLGLKPVQGQDAINAELPGWEQRLMQAWLELLQWGIGKIVVL